MDRTRLIKATLALLLKLAVLWLALPLVMIDLILLQIGMPRLAGFDWPPFLGAAAVALVLAALAARELLLVITLAILAAGVAFLHGSALYGPGFSVLLGATLLPAALNFLYRNRITEPMLALLPVLVLAYLFVSVLYGGAFILWVWAVAGWPLRDEPWQFVEVLFESSLAFPLMLPFSLMYLLGKHCHAPLLRRLAAMAERCRPGRWRPR